MDGTVRDGAVAGALARARVVGAAVGARGVAGPALPVGQLGRYPQFHGKVAESQVDGKYDSYTSQWLRDMWAMYNATNTTITTNTNTN